MEQLLREDAYRLGAAGYDWECAFGVLRESFPTLTLSSPLWRLAESRWQDGRNAR